MIPPSAQRGPNGRIVLLAGTILVVFLVVALRVGHLTIVQGEALRREADLQYRKILRLAGTRGAILARDRKTLAGTVATPSIYGSPRYHSLSSAQVQMLAAALELPPESLEERLASKRGFVWITRWASREQAQLIERLGLPGVGVIHEGRRKYPNGALASHVIGIAGASLKGQEGIELLYDEFMRGEDKVLSLERDGRGRTMLMERAASVRPETPEQQVLAPRATLELTIDARIQAAVERELAKGVIDAGADAGTAIVLDPWTGAVLALANVPSYDPNSPGLVGANERRNRAISDVFEPGSTFKAFTVAAALEEGVIQSDEIFDCENGSRRVGGWTINDHHPYGLLSVPEVIQFSSNIGISKIADRLGAERFARYVAAFGFGRKTGIDLPGEVPGLVRRGRWAAIDVATGSFGQGIATTPIQLAAAFGAIATGGRLHQPFVVSRAVDSKGRTLFDWDTAEQQAAASQPINEATARSVTAMLERVVAEKRGTGTRARIDGVRVAGKTGTAQKVDPNTGRYSRERLASFIGFAPADAPAVVTVVMIDNPRKATYGGIVAAPVFSEITERALDQLGRRPPPIAVESEPAPALVELAAPSEAMGTQDGVPSFVGMSLRLALDKARAEGLDVDVRGSGWVVAQEPPAGSPREGRKILLLLESRA